MVYARDTASKRAAAEKVKERRASIGELQKEVEKALTSEEGKKLAEEYQSQRQVYGPLADRAIALSLGGSDAEAQALLVGNLDRARGPYQAAIEAFVKHFEEH